MSLALGEQPNSTQPVAPTRNHGHRLAHTDAGHALHRDPHLLTSLARRLTRLAPAHLELPNTKTALRDHLSKGRSVDFCGDPEGSRTPVAGMKTRCPDH